MLIAGNKMDHLRRKNKIFEQDVVFLPLNKRSHWTLIIVVGMKKLLEEVMDYYLEQDSMRDKEIKIEKQ